MTESFDQFSVSLIAYYARLVRRHPAQTEAWREQVKRLEQDHPVFAGLEAKVRAKIEGRA